MARSPCRHAGALFTTPQKAVGADVPLHDRHQVPGDLGQHGWVPAAGGDDVELVDEGVGGDGPLDESAEAFPGVFVDDGQDLQWAAVVVASNWKSTAHALFGASAVGVEAVVLVPRRLRRRR